MAKRNEGNPNKAGRMKPVEFIFGFLFIIAGVMMLLSLIPHGEHNNYLGAAGELLGDRVLYKWFGMASLVLPVIFILLGWSRLKQGTFGKIIVKIAGFACLFISALLFFALINMRYEGGLQKAWEFNIAGNYLLGLTNYLVGKTGSWVLVAAFAVMAVYLLEREKEFILLFRWSLKGISAFFGLLKKSAQMLRLKLAERQKKRMENRRRLDRGRPEPKTSGQPVYSPSPEPAARVEIPDEEPEPPRQEKKKAKITPPVSRTAMTDFQLPPIDLLRKGGLEEGITGDHDRVRDVLMQTLRDFGIESEFEQYVVGPVVTRYEIRPSPGVKVSRFTGLADDIALALKASHIRIVAPIPGRSAVGIEIPNKQAQVVSLRELLELPEWKEARELLTIAIGKTIDGDPVFADLASMPHILIAGATGSGKSICLNTIVLSLLYRRRPDELKFLMIDPKRVELSIFRDIPHLYVPIINDAKTANNSLKKLVKEMEDRYKVLAAAGVRNIEAYNQKSDALMPYVVVVVDELADLMMAAAREVEESVIRLAQLARGVGIHLILATQRPSVDVITGLIKANMPSRIAFQVSSKVDSRIILDMDGADALLGRGDMLYNPSGAAKPKRVQGALVSVSETETVADFLRKQAPPVYQEQFSDAGAEGAGGFDSEEEQELFYRALRLVVERKKASTTLLKGAMRISDGKATNLISMMENKQLIGPAQGAKPRDIFYDRIEEILSRRSQEGIS